MLIHGEESVKLCEFDTLGEIVFTTEYLKLTEPIGDRAREFASYLVTHFEPGNGDLLDYFGPDEDDDDKYTGILGEPMDIREDKMDLLEYFGKVYDGLTAEWHRDLLRSKLVSLEIPTRLIKEYVKVVESYIK